MRLPPIICRLISIALLAISIRPAHAQVSFTTVALSGQPAPGIPGASIGSVHESIVMGSAGHVALWATICGPGIVHGGDDALWLGRPGSLQLVARADDPAPQVDDNAVFSNFDYFTLVSSTGQIFFNSAIVVRGVDDEMPDYAIYSGTPGSLKLLARSGRTIPGVEPSTRLQPYLWSFACNASGQVALASMISSDQPEIVAQQGVLIGAPGSFKLIAKTGQQAPGFPQGFVYHGGDGSDFTIHRLSAAGQVLFSADVSKPDTNEFLGRAFWTGDADSVQRVLYHGQPAPGVEAGRVIRYPTLSMNASGQIVLVCGLSETDSLESALYVGAPDNLRLIARSGQQAPGMPAGVRYQAFEYNSIFNPQINDAGIIAFTAFPKMPGTPEGFFYEGLWFGPPDNLRFIAVAEQPAPGLRDGFVFSSFEPQINNLGQLIFRGCFHGPGVPSGAGAWKLDSSGNVTLLFADGQLFDVGNGDLRTIERFHLGQLNDLGQLPFWANFTDGSTGLFLVTIPEPSTLSMLFLSSLMLFARNRRTAMISHKQKRRSGDSSFVFPT